MTEKSNPLKQLLEERGIKQIEIAQKLGIRRQNISNVVSGKDYSINVVTAIADELELSIDEINSMIPGRAA